MLDQKPKFTVGYRFQYEKAQQKHVILYPEGMIFPSIFWKMIHRCGAIAGAIPL